jgi:hypothetical protein
MEMKERKMPIAAIIMVARRRCQIGWESSGKDMTLRGWFECLQMQSFCAVSRLLLLMVLAMRMIVLVKMSA